MAMDYAGLFTNPQDIRNKRIDDLMKQQQATSQMGGSMSQLLGQVAASGSNVGNMFAELGAQAMGKQTKEEADATKMQELAKQINWDDPEELNQLAMMLNSIGMTKQALMVLDKRQQLIKDEMTMAKTKQDMNTRTISRPVTKYMPNPSDPYGAPIAYQTSIQITQEKDEKGIWRDVKETNAKPAETTTPKGDEVIFNPSWNKPLK